MILRSGIASLKSLVGIDIRVKIVDVGASPVDGPPPYADLIRGGIADVVGFDPDPGAQRSLAASKGASETYLPHAIADGRRHELHICALPGMTSLLTPNPDVLRLFHGFPDWGRVIAVEPIDTMRLDDVPETAGLDLLKIDIQGAELMAFRNAEARLAEALVIQTEVEFLPLYVDQPLFGDVDIFLRSRGFAFHKFADLASRVVVPMLRNNDIYAGMSQLAWADALYVRDITRLDALSGRQLLTMATILHDCYASFDVVMHILVHHDARFATGLAGSYLAGLQAAGNR